MAETKIKICGLRREYDIDYVNEFKPDYVGFITFKKSKRYVTNDEIIQLKKRLSSDIMSVAVFVNESIETILELIETGSIDLIQLHGNESTEFIHEIKKHTDSKIIKALAVGKDNIDEYDLSEADYLLLDNGAGGTGEAFDWSKKININKPFFLAGGLNCDNVLSGIEKFHPYSVDISGGVETDGYKDRDKISEIIRRIRNE